jgi:rhamnosyltransferase
MKTKIAIIGSRGIPAKYGGFETFVEEISTRLVTYDYDIYVSCEGGIEPKIFEYNGVKLFYFPIKPFYRIIYETVYDIYSMIKASLICDYIYILGYGAGYFFFIPKIFGKKLIVNVDGIEWKRAKYNRLEKIILYTSEKFAIFFADVIIADSKAIKRYIDTNYKKKAIFIPYGVTSPKIIKWDKIKLLNLIIQNKNIEKLEENDFYLVVARLEPENNIHMIIEGFLKSKSNKKLIVVGNFLSLKYKENISNIIKKYCGEGRVIFTGAIYNKTILNMLRQNNFVYIHGHSAGGTNPSLLEAMIMNNIIIAHDNEFNNEVGNNSFLYFDSDESLANIINSIENNKEKFTNLKSLSKDIVLIRYTWEEIILNYIELFKKFNKQKES